MFCLFIRCIQTLGSIAECNVVSIIVILDEVFPQSLLREAGSTMTDNIPLLLVISRIFDCGTTYPVGNLVEIIIIARYNLYSISQSALA